MEKYIYIIPLMPLIGFLINGLFGKNQRESVVGAIGTLAVFVPFLVSVSLFYSLGHDTTEYYQKLYSWVAFEGLSVDVSFLVDPLSVQMMMIITGIGSLIHLYSIGYMHGDSGFYKFFAYLNLFVFSMLLLVMGGNYLIMFFGWEGVGLCSYLLIGFWFKNVEYGYAARKAFVMNRIGDLGLLLGIFMLFARFGSFEYIDIFNEAKFSGTGDPMIVVATLLLFVGAMGKSAQIPLYTWLPDAMAGPTPVSALIHAATMVTAGIYMVVRSNVLYSAAPQTLHVIAAIGLATALIAGLIGVRQNDIKKVLAYSTVSQLGFIFLGLGVGAYSSAMFHLTTHAFFKALLFLSAGSVIHALHGEQDIRKMGGLKDHIKTTYIVFLIGTLAIAGIPPLSGMFSKDEILAEVFAQSKVLWVLGLGTSLITGVYMFRLLFLVFFGQFRGTAEQKHHLHESPPIMTVPLWILAISSVIGGILNLPHVLGSAAYTQRMKHFFDSVIDNAHHIGHLSASTELLLMFITVSASLVVAYIMYKLYVVNGKQAQSEEELKGIEKLMAHKFYVDELYDKLIVHPIQWFSKVLHDVVDKQVVDGMVNGFGQLVTGGSKVLRLLQNGNIEYYLLGMTVGAILLFILKFFV